MRSLSGSLAIVDSRVKRWYCSRSVVEGSGWLSAVNGLFVYWLCTGPNKGASHDHKPRHLSVETPRIDVRGRLHGQRTWCGPARVPRVGAKVGVSFLPRAAVSRADGPRGAG